MAPLPPDLSDLGDRLARAAEARLRERRRRRRRLARLFGTGLAALTVAILSPSAITPADRGLFQLAAASTGPYVPAACDQPRSATMASVRPCNPPGTTDSLPGSLARRMADR